jgi:hypothetical protein
MRSLMATMCTSLLAFWQDGAMIDERAIQETVQRRDAGSAVPLISVP